MTAAHPPGVDVTTRLTGGYVTCQCVKWHRPLPAEEEIHHVVPRGAPFHGPDVPANRRPVCPTTHSAVHACIRVHLKAREQNRVPTKLELRPYSKFVRSLAEQAMAALGPQAGVPLG